jgi:hypothetical protein
MKWIVCLFSFSIALSVAAMPAQNLKKTSTDSTIENSFSSSTTSSQIPGPQEFFLLETNDESIDEIQLLKTSNDASFNRLDFQFFRADFFAEIKVKESLTTKLNYPTVPLFLIFLNIRC